MKIVCFKEKGSNNAARKRTRTTHATIPLCSLKEITLGYLYDQAETLEK